MNRCFYSKEKCYHTIAFVPDSNKVIILCKNQASMNKDTKTQNQTEDGEAPKKDEYLLVLELEYMPSDQIENGHTLGIFTKLLRTYCIKCVAGQGAC